MTGRLVVQNIFTAYDRADVLSGLSIDVLPGTITCILGSNGAGKSTLIRSILRLTPPRAGSIAFDGTTLDRMQTHEIIGLGMACIPEGRRIFAKMTVEENLRAPIWSFRKRPSGHGWTGSTNPSRGSRNARGSWLAPCPAANRRWSRLDAA
jgi:ABC-type branched-subunit amino acid transport system ATPase component